MELVVFFIMRNSSLLVSVSVRWAIWDGLPVGVLELHFPETNVMWAKEAKTDEDKARASSLLHQIVFLLPKIEHTNREKKPT